MDNVITQEVSGMRDLSDHELDIVNGGTSDITPEQIAAAGGCILFPY